MATEAEITVRWAPEEPVHRTARTILFGLQSAEAALDIYGKHTDGMTVRQRADRILKAAQSGNLEPGLYKIAWFIERTFKR
ncbi:MAG: hypothetical protein WCD69_17335 [Xanthobacteraceae bacterium]